MNWYSMRLLFLLSLFVVCQATCPLNTVESPLYNSCYLFSHVRLRWSAAEAVCNLYGGHLTSIRSKEHESFITHNFLSDKSDNAWIGANYFTEKWKWSDGKAFSYNDFKKGTPKNTSAGVFVNNFPLSVSWQFMDDNDQTINGFICEIPRCKDGNSAAPLITPKDKNPYIYYADKAQKWFVTSHSIYEEAEVLESEKKCTEILSHLPSISNQNENDQYTTWLSKLPATMLTYMPIGYRTTMGAWQWTDGNQANYTNWAAGQPQAMQEDLVTLVNIKTGRWFSQSNKDSNNEYVCEFPLNKNYCQGIQP